MKYAERRFLHRGGDLVTRGEQQQPRVGKGTLVEAELDRDRRALPGVPGRQTLVEAEARNWKPFERPISDEPGRIEEAAPSLEEHRPPSKASDLDGFAARALDDVLAALAARPGGRRLVTAVRDGSAAPPVDPGTRAVLRTVQRHAATLYRHAVADGEVSASDPVIADALERAGAGEPLPIDVRHDMEQALGVSLARVRIHVDDVAARAALAVSARAFTVGEDIFFGSGAYSPATADGRKLLAHELAHVVQAYEGRTRSAAGAIEVSRPDDTLERDAEAVAARVAARSRDGEHPQAPLRSYGPIRSGALLRAADPAADGVVVLDSLIDHLIEFWERQKRVEPSRVATYDANIERLRTRGRPTHRQSEMEVVEIHSWVGGRGEESYKHGREAKRGGSSAKGATKPDVNLQSAMIEVKNYNVSSQRSVRKLLAEVERQVQERRQMGPYNVKHQSVIVDVRGQHVTPEQLASLRSQIAQRAGLAEEHIQFTCWSSDLAPPARPPTSSKSPPSPRRRASTATSAPGEAQAAPTPVGPSRVNRVLRRFGDMIGTLFSAKVQLPLAIVGELLGMLDAINMALGSLSGDGFVLQHEIEHAGRIENAAKSLLGWYVEQHDALQLVVSEATLMMAANGAQDIRATMRAHAGKLLVPLATQRTSVHELRTSTQSAHDEADRKVKLARSLVDSRELAILGAEFGTAVRATLFAASEDLSKIRGALWSAGRALDQLDALLQEDIEVLGFYR